MSRKTWCPVCDSTSSSVTQGLEADGECPYCKTPAELVFQITSLRERREGDVLALQLEQALVRAASAERERDALASRLAAVREALDGEAS